MLEPFSSKYYLGRYYVYPAEDNCARVDTSEYEALTDEYPVNEPLVAKIDSYHFELTPANGVPAQSITLPKKILAETHIERCPDLVNVLVARENSIADMFI